MIEFILSLTIVILGFGWMIDRYIRDSDYAVMVENRDDHRKCLADLVRLKIHKDKYGKDDKYKSLQPYYWDNAFDRISYEEKAKGLYEENDNES